MKATKTSTPTKEEQQLAGRQKKMLLKVPFRGKTSRDSIEEKLLKIV